MNNDPDIVLPEIDSAMTSKWLVIVTGASRGFGKEVTKAFAAAAATTREDYDVVHFVLVARSAQGLAATQTEVQQLLVGQPSSQPSCLFSLHAVDLGDLDTLDASIDKIFQSFQRRPEEGEEDTSHLSEKYDKIVLINNAGSLGHIGPCRDTPSLKELRQNVDLNVTSFVWLTIRFLGLFKQQPHPNATVVNISSLVAVQPFSTLALYSAGKTARDAYYKALSHEEEGEEESATTTTTPANNIKVLNYAPGPLETDMTEEIRQASSRGDLAASLRPSYAQRLVDPNDSAAVLVQLLLAEHGFENGAHVDYYDVVSSSSA